MNDEVLAALHAADLPDDEIGLRVALEACVPTWTLICLSKAAAKRWKAHYRLMMGAEVFDAATAAEAYARALLFAHQPSATTSATIAPTDIA